MRPDLIFLGGNPLINSHQTLSYIEEHLPGLDVECTSPDSRPAIGVTEWTDPVSDGAPWVTGDQRSAKFFGMVPTSFTGLSDSTMETPVTELKHDGGVTSHRRANSREIRAVVNLYAEDQEGLDYGMDWLVGVLSGGYCPTYGVPYCEGEQLTVVNLPDAIEPGSAEWGEYVDRNIRSLYDVKTLMAPRISEYPGFKKARVAEVEFILSAGNPFIYTPQLHELVIQNPTYTTADEITCDPEGDLYDQLITDPQLGDVVRPPRPPMIEPVDMPSSWSRVTRTIPEEIFDRAGQTVHRVEVRSGGSAMRMLRVRFYRPDAVECDYSGEFLVTYQPANSTLVIDGTSQKVRLLRSGQPSVSASNLVIGSDGRPAKWPTLDCGSALTVRVDYPSPRTELDVRVYTYGRR